MSANRCYLWAANLGVVCFGRLAPVRPEQATGRPIKWPDVYPKVYHISASVRQDLFSSFVNSPIRINLYRCSLVAKNLS